MYSPEVQSRIAIFTQKMLEGTLTVEEMKEAVTIMRGDRTAALRHSSSSRIAKAKSEIKHADDMLSELGDI
jgi:hypothetical protein